MLLLLSCKQKEEQKSLNALEDKTIQVQGHRGARGTMPENTIAGFIAAIKDSAEVLELDVVISKDRKVVVSHEPFMSSKYVLTPGGDTIAKEEEKSFNLYEMDYDSIRHFEVGLKGNRDFPEQRKRSAYKPLLGEVIDSIEQFIQKHRLKPVSYNIELKSNEEDYDQSQPQPIAFVELVMKALEEKPIHGRYNIQSFDANILEAMHSHYPEIPLAYLVYKPGISSNLEHLSFTPQIYSPNYNLVANKTFVDSVKKRNMKLVPWTVNDSAAIKKMISLEVDGIISDYPGRVKALIYGN